MASSWLLFSSALLVLVLLGSASTVDEDDFESLVMQREVDLSDLLRSFDMADPTILQREVGPGLTGPSGFSPRSMALPPSTEYPVQFPLARPTPRNLDAICLHADLRPNYPDSYFPRSGFGQLRRQATAVNTAESWFRSCCMHNQTWASETTLCCAQRAWTQSLKIFCRESSAIKDRLHHCCKLKGGNMFNCFDNEATNPQYQPTEEFPMPPLNSEASFDFAPSSCPSAETSPSSVRGHKRAKVPSSDPVKVDINFPLGRPTADSIQSLCDRQEQRRLYNLMCLKNSGHDLLALQAQTVNRMEKGFKLCCRKNKAALNCAKQKWSREIDRFCTNKGEKLDFQCCSATANDRHNCFQDLSSDPYYNMTSDKPSLQNLCDTYKIINKKFPVGFPLAGFVAKCCPLSGEEIENCYTQKLKAMSRMVCSNKKSSNPAVRHCCRMPAKDFPQCMSTILMNAINKATKVQSKKRKCPIS